MGNQQFGQLVQLDNPDEPLVQTSFEEIIPYIVSDRFAIKSKKKGKVHKITDEMIIVHNQDGTESKYSIKPTRSRTKRGIYIPMRYYKKVSEGQVVDKGQLLATTSSLKTGKLAAGKNLVVAEMSYRGMNYEDGWVIAEEIGEKYEQKILEKIIAIIPLDAKVSTLNIQNGKETRPGEILVSFAGATNVDSFVNEDDDDETADDVLTGMEFSGKNVNYRSPGGKIVDFSIKLNSKNVDSKLYKEWKRLSKDIEARQKECQILKHDHKAYVDCISDITNSEIVKIGGHSVNGSEFEGAVIEIYVERPNKIANGSKFTLAATGGKGTVQYIIPKGQEPVAEKTKLKIEFVPTPLSIISRKNISILLLMYSGKVIYFLNKKLQHFAQSNNLKKARELLLEIFTYLDKSTDKFLINEAMGFFDSKSPNDIKKYIMDSDPLNRPAFPLIVPPHKNKITMDDIQKAAAALDIPLNEKVKIVEEDIITEKEVPVGIMPVIYLEHFPKAMSGSRGSLSVGRQHTTGQGRSGTRVGAGAIKLGLYDLFAMSYKEPGLLVKEIHGLHADNKEARKKFQKEVLKTGKMPEILNMKINADDAKTKQLVEVFFKGAMLEPDL
jgi:DNA-directed RNA polymerase beta subunit